MLYEKYIKKLKMCNPVTLDFWMGRGFTLQQSLEKVSIEQKKRAPSSISKESANFFTPIIDFCIKKGISKSSIFAGKFTREKSLPNPKKKYYLYDFCIEPLKIIIEYQGIRFHIKDINDQEEIKKFKNPHEIWEKQLHKKEIAIQNGYLYFEYYYVDNNTQEFYNMIFDIISKRMQNDE